jgi:hypothetical protein
MRDSGWDLIKWFNTATICMSYPNPVSRLSTQCRDLCFVVFSWLKWEGVVCVIDIDGIVDGHCFNFLFINKNLQN